MALINICLNDSGLATSFTHFPTSPTSINTRPTPFLPHRLPTQPPDHAGFKPTHCRQDFSEPRTERLRVSQVRRKRIAANCDQQNPKNADGGQDKLQTPRGQ
ncbi:hypothetical protein MJO29_006098 [Puccinia striiformis f. sp. tritici]|uniref:hypothetical protein n=1 Tax=Puccinia striiformis f. sp. tritici TaxID=168172 RepID=UPI0020088FAF|nr:hypothetical protein Pst134EA_011313 [Puccinia striiformis f. sp. tritici]KAH9467678.1 hypothetical protein Pst134EA_011313 [Puccinia striiformis f. sp. tritici]KAI7957881.1 hypothetical protein MJO29_006098 [Puccinia striiformis f. sp. tritici]